MRINPQIARLLCATAPLTFALQAQSVKISPSYTTVGVNGTVQYSAKVTGLTNSSVTWFVVGVLGGNSTYGTITPGGLYTAPAKIPANGITISALASDNKTSSIVYVAVEPPGPAITSVSPSPIPVGSYSVTLTGSGFQAGAIARIGGVNLSTTFVNPTTLKTSGYQGATGTGGFQVMNPETLWGAPFPVTFVSKTPSPSPSPNPSPSPSPQTIAPATVSLNLGATQQFTSAGATSWNAVSGTVTATGLYTAPTIMPVGGTDTVTATGSSGSAHATVTLSAPPPPSAPPVITGVGSNGQLPLGLFSTTITGTGFLTTSIAKLNGSPLTTTLSNGLLTASGFASVSGSGNITVSNGSSTSQPFSVQIGLPNTQASAAAARRFLEQAAFGPTPSDAANVQTLGFQGWLSQQFNLPQVSNYNSITSSQGGLPGQFLTNAVMSSDQLRQRVAFALSQIFVTSIQKLIWNSNMVLYQNMLLADAFTNYRQIMADVTLSPAMGQYLDMANNAQANPATGSLANENFARELMQLFTIGTQMLNPDGSVRLSGGLPIPTYSQSTIAEFARVYTGWTYAPAAGQPVQWDAYITSNGPMVPYPPEHDSGAKQLLSGFISPAGVTPQQDLNNALDNIFNHPNVGPFVGKQLIQHLVKSNPSPAYISRVTAAFNDNGHGVRGDMQAVISAVLLDPEARANDNGGNDQAADGHLQEPALFISGMVRAFGGQMTNQNYFPWDLTNLDQDIFDAPSVFNYFSPTYGVPGSTVLGPEFEIHTPNNAIWRANVVRSLFSQWSNPVQSYGPGTTVDLTPFVALAANPATLVNALDLTLTHGTMPAAMKSGILNAVIADSGGPLQKVEDACYLILTSGYYNVWH